MRKLFVLFVLLASLPTFAEEVVNLQADAYVVSERVSLLDLVEPNTVLSQATSNALKRTEVARLEKSESIVFERAEIVRKLREHGDKLEKNYIPNQVKVSRTTPKIFCAKVVRSGLKKMFGAQKVSISNLKVNLSRWDGEEIAIQFESISRNGSFRFPITASDGSTYKTVGLVSGNYKIYKRVPVAKRSLRVGHPILISDFEFDLREITHVRDSFPNRVGLLSSEVRRPKFAGNIIRHGDLRPENLVKRGKKVKAFLSGNNWKIHFSALAKKDGSLGETIPIKNDKTKKTLEARVVGRDAVEIDP